MLTLMTDTVQCPDSISIRRLSCPAPAGDIALSDPFIFEPTSGAVSQPVVRYSAASASCGFPGCATTYSKVPAIQHIPVTPLALPLTVTHEVLSSHQKAVEFHPEARSMGIHSLGR